LQAARINELKAALAQAEVTERLPPLGWMIQSLWDWDGRRSMPSFSP
jgi:hypothetical protein